MYLNDENYLLFKRNLELRAQVEKSIAAAKIEMDKLKQAITILGGDIYDANCLSDRN